MIRIGLSTPALPRLRLRAQITYDQVCRSARAAREGVLTVLRNDLAVLRRIPRVFTRRSDADARATAKAYTLMQLFEAQYQNLVDLLCWAAKDGVHTDRDARYAELRAWFLQNYEAIRPALLRHLYMEPEDIAPAEPGARAPRDAFESLFLPSNVDAIINSETVISRIMRTRCALDSYREQLDSMPS